MAAKKTTKTAAPAPAPPAKKATKTAAKKAATKKAPVKSAAPKAKSTPKASFDEIAKAAYLIYRRRIGLGLPGTPESDWLQAEKEVNG